MNKTALINAINGDENYKKPNSSSLAKKIFTSLATIVDADLSAFVLPRDQAWELHLHQKSGGEQYNIHLQPCTLIEESFTMIPLSIIEYVIKTQQTLSHLLNPTNSAAQTVKLASIVKPTKAIQSALNFRQHSSILCLPLTNAQHETIGVIYLENYQKNDSTFIELSMSKCVNTLCQQVLNHLSDSTPYT